ncbi:MAG TPA: zf-HC2 domain-containing protein [Candidatus Binatia bacterium]
MKCEEVIGSIVALLDGEVAPEERARLESHLASCAACQGELERLRATRTVIERHLKASAVGAGSFDALWQRIEAEGASSPTAQERAGGGAVLDLESARRTRGARGGNPSRARWLPGWAAMGGLAAAAALALVIVSRETEQRPAGPAPAPPQTLAARETGAPQPKGEPQQKVDPAPQTQVAAAKRAPAKQTQTAQTATSQPQAAKPAQPERREQPEPVIDEDAIEAVALGEADPPRDLLERPDLFLDFPIVRKLDELQHLDAVLAESPGDGESGGAG